MTEIELFNLSDSDLLKQAVAVNRELNRRGLLECFETSIERQRGREVEAKLVQSEQARAILLDRAIFGK